MGGAVSALEICTLDCHACLPLFSPVTDKQSQAQETWCGREVIKFPGHVQSLLREI
jgi:hypothetical protein